MMRAVRVLVVTKIFPNACDPTGAPFNRQQFAALARRDGVDVEVLATIPWFPGVGAFSRWSKAGQLTSVPKREQIAGLDVEHPRFLYLPKVGHSVSGGLYAASLVPQALARRGMHDVVLGSWAYPDGAAAVLLARLLGIPAVVKLHGSDMNVVAQMRGPRRTMRALLPRAERIVAVSRGLADQAVRLGVAPERIDLVQNGVDASIFHPRPRAEARAKLGLAAARRWILYVGRLEKTKGVIDLLQAFDSLAAAHPDLGLLLVGDGSARIECEQLARAHGDRIVFAGAQPLEEVPTWVAACDFLTLPSWNEGTPNVLLEALACGRRVVATRVGGCPDVVSSPELGELVPVRDVPALAAALAAAAHQSYDPDAVAALGARGGWDDSAARLCTTLERARESFRNRSTQVAAA
jgi:teichuronic acid biosynthesis glycosyltransferase TuaC